MSGLGPVIAIAVAGQQSIALKSDGTVWAWGRDPEMALNLGCIALSTRHTVWQIPDAADSSFLNSRHAIWGSSGSFFARKADGSVVAWGRNEMNKLGGNPPALAKSASKPPPEIENGAVLGRK